MNVTSMFATAATAEQTGAGIGVIWFAVHPPGEYALTVVDYDIWEISSIDAAWVEALCERSAQLAAAHEPENAGCRLRVEHPGLVDILKRAQTALLEAGGPDSTGDYGLKPVGQYETARWPATLDERAFAIRPLIDSGRAIKLEKGLRKLNFRAWKTNHLVAQIKAHRPGDAASAGELLQAFVLGVLLGTRPTVCFFTSGISTPPRATASSSNNPFGGYIRGRRPR